MRKPRRTLWHAPSLAIPNKPLWRQLLAPRYSDREHFGVEGDTRVITAGRIGAARRLAPNLVSSITDQRGWQLPVLDLDEPHEAVPSATPGHTHLYLNRPIRTWRWVILMIGLRIGHVIEPGTFVWSLRRGGNFVRLPGVVKTEAENTHPDYGWFFKKNPRDWSKPYGERS